MKWFVLFVVTGNGYSQDFFGETACMRAVHELAAHKVTAFCTPRHIK